MDKVYTDIAIIGGGASGLACAAAAAKNYYDNGRKVSIVIIEKEARVGKKLLATGNGRCNFTNINSSEKNYFGTFKKYIPELFSEQCPDKVIGFFESIGLVCKTETDGRVYPYSKQSSSVLDVLRLVLGRLNVKEICNEKVESIVLGNNNFIVNTKTTAITAKKIVMAVGGKSSPDLGSDGSCFSTLQKMGHRIIPMRPSLTPIYVESPLIKSLKGVRAEGTVSLFCGDELEAVIKRGETQTENLSFHRNFARKPDGALCAGNIKSETGEIQFTENAVSGICAFNLSRHLYLQGNCKLSINLLPGFTFEKTYKMVLDRVDLFKNDLTENLFTGLFQKRVGLALLKACGIPLNVFSEHLKDSQIKELSKLLIDWQFKIKNSKCFKSSQVTAGGVLGDEINCRTMESKIINNMYIIGEMIDIDGECGGHNLQFAFATGILAGRSLGTVR